MARLATLTPQQVRVLMMLSEGLLNKQIAYELSVSEATVKAHVSAILQKLGVESRTQAVIAAAKIEVGQWPQAAADTMDQGPTLYSAAATRCTRHCASSARSAAGFTGLLSTWMSCSARILAHCGLRSAVIRIAGRSAPKRRRSRRWRRCRCRRRDDSRRGGRSARRWPRRRPQSRSRGRAP